MTVDAVPDAHTPAGLRARAERCRSFAREYASDVGNSLTELAVELDGKADRLDARDGTNLAVLPAAS